MTAKKKDPKKRLREPKIIYVIEGRYRDGTWGVLDFVGLHTIYTSAQRMLREWLEASVHHQYWGSRKAGLRVAKWVAHRHKQPPKK